jgi:hypothetical protein
MSLLLILIVLCFVINPAWSWEVTKELWLLIQNNWKKLLKKDD